MSPNITQVAVNSVWNNSYGSMGPLGHVGHLALVMGTMPSPQWINPKRWLEVVLFGRKIVELLGSPYYKGVPLPRIPSIHKLGTKSRIAQRTEHATVGRRGTYSHAGQSTTKPRRQYSKPDGIAQHASKTRIPRNRAVIDTARHPNGISRRRVNLQLRAPVKQ